MDKSEFLNEALKNPEWAHKVLARMEAQDSMIEFVAQAWHVIEPASRKFQRNWHLDAIADHLLAVSNNEIRRLLINIPPGCMKSLLCAACFPAWEWGPRNKPGMRYVRFSYAAHLSERDNLKTRQIIQSPWYQEFWGDRVVPNMERWGTTKFSNKETGTSFASAVSGVGTGERGDRVICDDLHNVADAESAIVRDTTVRWFEETMQTRVNDPSESAIIVIMQRVHSRDVSGHILDKELGYEHLCLPMEFEESQRCYTFVSEGKKTKEPVCQDPRGEEGELLWPARFTKDYLFKDLYKSMTRYAVSGQMQQRPVPREGGLLKKSDFRYVDIEPSGGEEVRGWDLAGSTGERADWTVGVRIKRCDGRFFVCDVERFRGTALRVRNVMRDKAEDDGDQCHIDFPQDPGQAGKAQARDLTSNLAGFRVHSGLESGSKVQRLEPFVAQVEAGNVYLVVGDWNDAYLEELCAMPNSQYDDQGDGTSRAFNRLARMEDNDDMIVMPRGFRNPNTVVRLHG